MVIKPIVEWKNPLIRAVSYVLFYPIALLFGLSAEFRNILYDRRILKAAVCNSYIIGVGSLSVGGSGKTPLVEFLAERLARNEAKIGVVSNGYRKKSAGTVIVSDGRKLLTDVFYGGDEAYVMAVNFLRQGLRIPVISGPDRLEAIRILEAQLHCDVVILDDAFQYRKVKKSVEFNVQDYLEYGYPFFVLPVGRLREFKKNLKRADAVIITKSPAEFHTQRILDRDDVPFLVSRYQPVSLGQWFNDQEIPLETITNQKVILFSALGYNTSFQHCAADVCARYHAEIVRTIEFQDHRWYTRRDIQRIFNLIPEHSATNYIVLTTQKDSVKISAEWIPKKMRERVYFLRSEFRMDSQIQFENMIKIPHIEASNNQQAVR